MMYLTVLQIVQIVQYPSSTLSTGFNSGLNEGQLLFMTQRLTLQQIR